MSSVYQECKMCPVLDYNISGHVRYEAIQLTCTLTFKWDLMSKHNEDLPQTKMKMFHRQLWCKLTTLPPSPSHHNLTKLFSRNHREPRRFLRHYTEASFVEWSGSLQQRPKALAVNANRKGTLVNRQCN